LEEWKRKKESVNDNDVFLGNVHIQDVDEKLMEDIRPFPLIPNLLPDDGEKGRLWIGNKGHYSHLHFDAHHGFLCVVSGIKEAWLYEPLYHLDIIPLKDSNSNASSMNPLYPDQYPDILKAKPIKIRIEAGQVLLIPMYWWHFIMCVDDSVAVNFWLYPHIQSSLSKYKELYPLTRKILRTYINQVKEEKFKLLTKNKINNFYQISMKGKIGQGDEWDNLYKKASKKIRKEILDIITHQ